MSFKETMAETPGISDLSFEDYNKRQLSEISAERNRERALKAKLAGHFQYDNNAWSPLKYEGFAVVSMLNENEGNDELSARLVKIQQELRYNLLPKYAFYYLPPESFHQTVANTLSADRFKNNILNAGLEERYPAIVEDTFRKIQTPVFEEPVKMKMAGLSVFGTAIGILGIFESEEDYNRITHFRKEFYADGQLADLDVKMTRPFIGHITLAYIEHGLNKNQKDQLAIVINEINESLSEEENYFYIHNTGLKRYHHLAEFIGKDNYPFHTL